jgi:hypothetical protein
VAKTWEKRREDITKIIKKKKNKKQKKTKKKAYRPIRYSATNYAAQ